MHFGASAPASRTVQANDTFMSWSRPPSLEPNSALMCNLLVAGYLNKPVGDTAQSNAEAERTPNALPEPCRALRSSSQQTSDLIQDAITHPPWTRTESGRRLRRTKPVQYGGAGFLSGAGRSCAAAASGASTSAGAPPPLGGEKLLPSGDGVPLLAGGCGFPPTKRSGRFPPGRLAGPFLNQTAAG